MSSSFNTKIHFRSLINHSAKEVFEWHLRARLAERCIPPPVNFEVVYSGGRPNKVGSKLVLRLKFLNLFWLEQIVEYTSYVENEAFTLHETKGFFKDYEYETVINPQGSHTAEIIDNYKFTHHLPRFFDSLIKSHFKKRIGKLLSYKHALIDHDLGMIEKYPFEKPYKILISGSHGMIGKDLMHFLEFMGHEVWHLSRTPSDEDRSIVWDPEVGEYNLSDFENFDVIIHLAGESLSKGWWTKRKKERVLKSRTQGTDQLVQLIKKLSHPPKTFISASAIGYYGNRGSEVVNEESGPGKGLFISEVCEQWERAGKELEEIGVRVVCSRFGLVLSASGGALKKMLLPFKCGLGGRFGSGHQYISWVAMDDVVGSLYHTIMTPDLKGAINIVAPYCVTNDVFTKKLAQVLGKWLAPPIPEFVIRFFMGQRGEELLLSSTRVEPRRLLESGYNFHYPKLCLALEHVI